MAASLARLTSLSTQTLSLLLERQRLQNLPSNSTSLHAPQIVKNLQQLRAGILELEEKEGERRRKRISGEDTEEASPDLSVDDYRYPPGQVLDGELLRLCDQPFSRSHALH